MDRWIVALRDGDNTPIADGLVARHRRISTAASFSESLPPGDARLCVVVAGDWTITAPAETVAGCGAFLIGPTDRATEIATSGGEMIVVEFAVGGWSRLLAAPAYRAANRVMCLDPSSATAQRAATHPSAARDSLAGLVLAALGDEMLPSVEQLAGRAGVSSRTLHRCCTDTFGFGPLTLLKRERLLRTLRDMQETRPRRIADIIPIDYFDQSHFNREFKAFMGATPTEYRRRLAGAIAA